MKILLVSRTPYHPLSKGGVPVNMKGIAELATARGDEVVQFALAMRERGHDGYIAGLRARGTPVESRPGVDIFAKDGYTIHAAHSLELVARQLDDAVDEFRPDGVLVAADCFRPEHVTLLASEPLWRRGCPIGYLMVGSLNVPFGPLSVCASEHNQRLLARADRLFSVCRHVDEHLRRWSDYTSDVFYVPSYGAGPFRELANPRGAVTLINASVFKGLPILLELAQRMPDVPFAAVKSWATTPRDVEQMSALPNIEVLEFCPDIEQILARTRVLLTPSLIPEGFPLVTVEAMLRGVPVVSSDSGGLPEAKLGTDYVIPVDMIDTYAGAGRDEAGLPHGVVPEQRLEPWIDAIDRLMRDDAQFAAQSHVHRRAATAFVDSLGLEPLDRLFGSPPMRARR